jgi:hypothetical protein
VAQHSLIAGDPMSDYLNADGVADQLSRIPCAFADELYPSGTIRTFRYTGVAIDVPFILNSSGTVIDEWPSISNPYIVNLSTMRYGFETHIPFYPNTLEVYLNGEPLDDMYFITTGSGSNRFQLRNMSSTGYLWTSYVPMTENMSLAYGYNKSTIEGSYAVIAEHRTPEMAPRFIVRARQIVNSLERYCGLPMTVWTGFMDNISRGTPGNIVPGVTGISFIHLTEIVHGIQAIETCLDTTTAGVLTRYAFPEMKAGNLSMINYIEHIYTALGNLETVCSS